MKSFLNFFKSESKELPETRQKWIKGHRAFERGKFHLIAHHDQEALDCFDEAVNCGFENAEVFGLRGCCLESLEWELDAIEDFTKAISFDQEDCNLYFQRSIAKLSVGDKIGSDADLHEAIRLSRIEGESNANYNESARQMGWPDAATMYSAQLLIQTPDFILAKNSERAKLRGKRPVKQNGS